jgi:hypothetical protein
MKMKWMAAALAASMLASGFALAHGGGMMGEARESWQSLKSRANEMAGLRSSSGDMGCPMMGGGGMMGQGMMGGGMMGGGTPNEQWRGRDARPGAPEQDSR